MAEYYSNDTEWCKVRCEMPCRKNPKIIKDLSFTLRTYHFPDLEGEYCCKKGKNNG